MIGKIEIKRQGVFDLFKRWAHIKILRITGPLIIWSKEELRNMPIVKDLANDLTGKQLLRIYLNNLGDNSFGNPYNWIFLLTMVPFSHLPKYTHSEDPLFRVLVEHRLKIGK